MYQASQVEKEQLELSITKCFDPPIQGFSSVSGDNLCTRQALCNIRVISRFYLGTFFFLGGGEDGRGGGMGGRLSHNCIDTIIYSFSGYTRPRGAP